MDVVDLGAIGPTQRDLVGGKAAGLAALIRLGERVPDGFCVTTDAQGHDQMPGEQILAAYDRLGGGPVAVRSSGTAEDLPDASFAGQHSTFLAVDGADELLAAIRACWDSLHSETAIAYRTAAGIAHDSVRMAVIVQRMVDAETSGVLFTANPLTGSRAETVVDATRGLGAALVDGTVAADHYVVNGTEPEERGCLTPAQLTQLRETGERLQGHFGAPQDVEWSFDHAGTLWLLQSRQITTLFPAPPASRQPGARLYVEFGHVQGMLRPVTPMGMAMLKTQLAGMLASVGMTTEIVDIGGRLYADLTDAIRDPSTRQRLVRLMGVDFGPRAQAAVEHLLNDPRFGPRPNGRRPRPAALATAFKAVPGILGALARPAAARARVLDRIEQLRQDSPTDPTSTTELLALLEHSEQPASGPDPITWPVVAGIMVTAALPRLLAGVAGEQDIATVLGGMPHNVTIEMDLALWQVAQQAARLRDRLLHTSPNELATAYLTGRLPDIGLTAFLDTYGHRCAAEVDVGVPRWAEDPAPVFTMLANYLRVSDPEQAPDRRFALAAARAEARLTELAAQARRRNPVRGRHTGLFLRRARELAGLREAGKFIGLYSLRDRRRRLLLVGAHLHAAGRLEKADDVMFLTLPELRTVVDHGIDLRGTVADRRSEYAAQLRRRTVPVALLSDGTDVETLLPAPAADGRTLTGVGASAGRVRGRARVVHDPATAHIEPGEILITPTSDPGWTPLFLTAGGLVTETGAAMAHGPTVAREYGIPAVICVPDATVHFRTGQWLTVDGATGTVTIGEAHDRQGGDQEVADA